VLFCGIVSPASPTASTCHIGVGFSRKPSWCSPESTRLTASPASRTYVTFSCFSCASGERPIVSAHTAHFGEEPCLSGTKGAGNIFFGNCNLRCVYCQNFQISQDYAVQKFNEVSVERLAEMALELQARGCHNIGFVSPTHFAPQMARAVLLAARRGLTVPIIYNTNAYDSVGSAPAGGSSTSPPDFITQTPDGALLKVPDTPTRGKP
jgi:hypothetical protein